MNPSRWVLMCAKTTSFKPICFRFRNVRPRSWPTCSWPANCLQPTVRRNREFRGMWKKKLRDRTNFQRKPRRPRAEAGPNSPFVTRPTTRRPELLLRLVKKNEKKNRSSHVFLLDWTFLTGLIAAGRRRRRRRSEWRRTALTQ